MRNATTYRDLLKRTLDAWVAETFRTGNTTLLWFCVPSLDRASIQTEVRGRGGHSCCSTLTWKAREDAKGGNHVKEGLQPIKYKPCTYGNCFGSRVLA